MQKVERIVVLPSTVAQLITETKTKNYSLEFWKLHVPRFEWQIFIRLQLHVQ